MIAEDRLLMAMILGLIAAVHVEYCRNLYCSIAESLVCEVSFFINLVMLILMLLSCCLAYSHGLGVTVILVPRRFATEFLYVEKSQ